MGHLIGRPDFPVCSVWAGNCNGERIPVRAVTADRKEKKQFNISRSSLLNLGEKRKAEFSPLSDFGGPERSIPVPSSLPAKELFSTTVKSLKKGQSMKKRKLLLAALAASMLIPSAMVPVNANTVSPLPVSSGEDEPRASTHPALQAYGFRRSINKKPADPVTGNTNDPTDKWLYADNTASNIEMGSGKIHDETLWFNFDKPLPEGEHYWLEVKVTKDENTTPDVWGIYYDGNGTSKSCKMSLLTLHQWEKYPANVAVEDIYDDEKGTAYTETAYNPATEGSWVLRKYLNGSGAKFEVTGYHVDANTYANDSTQPKSGPTDVSTLERVFE